MFGAPRRSPLHPGGAFSSQRVVREPPVLAFVSVPSQVQHFVPWSLDPAPDERAQPLRHQIYLHGASRAPHHHVRHFLNRALRRAQVLGPATCFAGRQPCTPKLRARRAPSWKMPNQGLNWLDILGGPSAEGPTKTTDPNMSFLSNHRLGTFLFFSSVSLDQDG